MTHGFVGEAIEDFIILGFLEGGVDLSLSLSSSAYGTYVTVRLESQSISQREMALADFGGSKFNPCISRLRSIEGAKAS